MQIQQLTADQVERDLSQLTLLLQNVVDDGASIGFLRPLNIEDAQSYWQSVINAIKENSRLLWVAQLDGTTVGTLQLDLCMRQNGPHRAEVMKVMVHTSQRGKGIGKALMQAMETEALRLGRTTLVLDTLKGDAGERLYQSLGWMRVGEIPAYVCDEKGELLPTVYYYKLLE
jgi:GNAT superfamily N-acetyltransferase